MPLPRAHGLYNRLLSVNIFYLYTATALCIALITAGWWQYWYQPSCNVADALQQNINHLVVELNELRKSERMMASLSKSIDAVKPDVQKKSDRNLAGHHRQQNLAFITECATTAGLAVEACRFCSERTESWCCVNELAGNFKGTYEQLMAFFDALKNAKKMIEINTCQLLRADTTLFNAQISFSLYQV